MMLFRKILEVPKTLEVLAGEEEVLGLKVVQKADLLLRLTMALHSSRS